MKRIHYASGSMLTGDDIADVLVRFAAALAHNKDAAEVRAPAIVENGTTGEVLMLLGPASQIMVEGADYAGPELRDTAFVADFEERIAALGPPRAGYVANGTENLPDVDLDLL